MFARGMTSEIARAPPPWRTGFIQERLPLWLQCALLFGGYLVLGDVSYRLELSPPGSTVWWLPQGLVLAAFVASSRRHWPAFVGVVFAAEAITVLLHRGSLPVALSWAVSNCVVAVLAGTLLRWWPGKPLTLGRVRENLALAVFGAFVAPAAGALIASWAAVRWLGAGSYWQTFAGWLLSDALGVLTVAPVLLTWSARRNWPRGRRLVEGGVKILLCAVVTNWVFHVDGDRAYVGPLPYLLFPFTLWGALRFGSLGAASVSLLIAGIAIFHTAEGLGPFALPALTTRQQIWSVQAYLGVLGISSLLLAATIAQRRAAERRQALLIRAGELFSTSLEREVTLGKLSRHLVESFADGCAVLLYEDDHLTPAAVAHAHALEEERLWRRLREAPAAPLLPADPRRELQLPLIVRGQDLGRLVLTRSQVAPPFGAEERKVAAELARRCADALETMRLFRERGEAIAARDEFLSIAGHELRTPITTLKLVSQTLTELLVLPEAGDSPVARKLHMLDRQISRIIQLVETLLDVGRISTGHFELEVEDVELAQLARDVTSAMSEDLQKAGCELELITEPVSGTWDRLRVEQVLTNLLTNAIKFGAGKPIEVRVERRGELARISVRDRGLGVPADAQVRIFERFERAVSIREYGGLGLGLYLSSQIAGAHHGRITVHSEQGSGSTFVLELPAHPTSTVEIAGSRTGPGLPLPP